MAAAGQDCRSHNDHAAGSLPITKRDRELLPGLCDSITVRPEAAPAASQPEG
jgi:hypothetical protein